MTHCCIFFFLSNLLLSFVSSKTPAPQRLVDNSSSFEDGPELSQRSVLSSTFEERSSPTLSPTPPTTAKERSERGPAPPVRYRALRNEKPPVLAVPSSSGSSAPTEKAEARSAHPPPRHSTTKPGGNFRRSTIIVKPTPSGREVLSSVGPSLSSSSLTSMERSYANTVVNAEQAKPWKESSDDESLFHDRSVDDVLKASYEASFDSVRSQRKFVGDKDVGLSNELRQESLDLTPQSSAALDPPLNCDRSLSASRCSGGVPSLRSTRNGTISTPQSNALLTSALRSNAVHSSMTRLQSLKAAMTSLQKERESMLNIALRRGGRADNASISNLRERVRMLRREVTAVQ